MSRPDPGGILTDHILASLDLVEEVTRVLNLLKDNKQWFENELKILRPGYTASITIPEDVEAFIQVDQLSGFNHHFRVKFNDQVEWLLRVRKHEWGAPPEIARQSIESEVTVLNILKQNGLPVPEAFFPPSFTKSPLDPNSPPLDYFYYEKLRGKACTQQVLYWDEPPDRNEEQVDQFIEEYAKVQIQLSNNSLPLNKIGCVYPSSRDPHGYAVGPIQTRGCFMRPLSPYLLGPFATQKERYLAHIDAALHYITHNALQASNRLSNITPVDEYLWHLELRELVCASKQLDEVPDQVFFKHADEKSDRFMVDDEQKIIGILDWEWAYVTTKAEAFAAPDDFSLRRVYLEGLNTMSYDEKKLIACYERLQRPDLADCVRNGRLYTRLTRIGLYDPG
ncbi:hypothetical protein I317_02941 [Kwoniella heveanensis CBS 569]|nr:hypothetical protein I317_02941 [Kwoniella heveanensis CBS 569]